MKIVLTTFGSRGDVQPMLALSLALESAGHDVLLAGPPEKAGWAQQLGCPFRPFGSDITAFMDNMKNAHSLRAAIRFVAYVRRELRDQFRTLPKIIAGADLVVGSSLVFALSSLAESESVPYRYIAFTPQILPSSQHPFPAFKHQRLPGWYNRATWRTARLLDRLNLTRLINQERRHLGLFPARDAWSHILGDHVIVASDSAISKVPPDVAIGSTQTGYMHLDQPSHDLPELEAFLASGSPPVYAGFGSMPKHDQACNVSLIVEAARSAGQRVIIVKFWDEPSGIQHSDDVFFIRRYPHLDLFPRMAAVIHHGGAGTTATSAISGVPQIIVPHALDQYYWGHQIHQSGLGSRPIWRAKLTPRRLGAAIQECLSNDQMRERAKAAQGTIKRHNSLQTAARELLKAVPGANGAIL